MKRILLLIFIVATMTSCEKQSDLKFSKVILGGCFLEKTNAGIKSYFLESDTVIYSIIENNLEIFVGFNAACCADYSSTAQIEGDSILIKVTNTSNVSCDCICYYTCNFKFTGNGKNYKYTIFIDDQLRFKGLIDL